MRIKINRILDNLCKMTSYSVILSKEEVEFLIDTHSDLIFCKGIARRIKFDSIIESRYRVSTEEI